MNVPLGKDVRVVVSHVFPSIGNNLPFRWEAVNRLRRRLVSIRLQATAEGLSVESIAAGND